MEEEILEKKTQEKGISEENGKSGILTAVEEEEKKDIWRAIALEEERGNMLTLTAARREAAKAERRFWMISP